jgi:carbon monoxide dehydrogenase subunit G
MEISKTFVVKASAAAAWSFLTDPRRVARCLPGAAITEQVDEKTHAGTITVKVGPVTATYNGTMRFERLDAAAWTAEIVAKGQEIRGKGGADMRMTSRLIERAPGETEVAVTSLVNVIGVLAQYGRGMIQDVSDQLFQKFVEAARAELEMPAASEISGAVASAPASTAPGVAPIQVMSFGAGVIGRAAGRAARRPVVWAAVIFALLVMYWLWRR